uniref:Uncharacterized protein n=1 Tax=Oryza glumipatula TaxID=40148 RepID=A0A0D9ZBL8_9ORYZ
MSLPQSRSSLTIPSGEMHGGRWNTIAVRPILDFTANVLDDDDGFLFHAAEEPEWSHYEAKHRTSVPPPPSRDPQLRRRRVDPLRGQASRFRPVCAVRRILDFAVDGVDDNDDFLFHATEETEWSHVQMTKKM